MRAKIVSDRSVRTITIAIEPGSVPDLRIPDKGRKAPHALRPDEAVLTLDNGRPTSLSVFGFRVLATGRVSRVSRASHRWWSPDQIPFTPVWARKLWAEAPWQKGAWQ